jgi:hypothetical protein
MSPVGRNSKQSNQIKMKKQNVLTFIVASLPSYFSLFSNTLLACIIIGVATMLGIILTGNLDKDEYWLKDKMRLGWIIHLLGVCIVVAFHNLKP